MESREVQFGAISSSKEVGSNLNSAYSSLRSRLNEFLRLDFFLNYAIWIMLLVFGVAASFLLPSFSTPLNLRNILMHSAVLGVIVIGESICLISGHFDLSVGSVLGFSAVFSALLASSGVPPILVMILALGTGGLIGFANGFFIRKVGINAFVVTLSMFIGIRGLTSGIVRGQTIWSVPSQLRVLGSTYVYGIPMQIIVFIGLYIIFERVLSLSVYGKRLYITGDNDVAAYEAGINTDRVVIESFIISGVLAALAGIISVGKLNSAPPTLGEGMVFEAFAAAVIGGISLKGGIGNLYNAFGGVLLLSLIGNILNLSDVSPYWIQTVRGGLILVAVLLDAYRRRRKSYGS